MGHIVLDLTSLAYQPVHPKRHVTFAMSKRKPAYPAHAQDKHEDDDERLLAQRDHTVVSDDGDDQLLVQPAPRKEPAEERRDPATNDGHLAPFVPPRPPPAAPVRRRKDRQYGKTQLPHWKKRCQETRVSEQRMPRFLAKRQKVKPYATLSTSCLTSAT